MADVVDKATRSRMMAGIKGKDTSPELVVRKFLFAAGFRYRLHVRELPGRPDIVMPKLKSVVFVHGCFWHRHPSCKYAYTPKSNKSFWRKKFLGNIRRDSEVRVALKRLGWKVHVIWGCQISKEKLNRLSIKLSSTHSSAK